MKLRPPPALAAALLLAPVLLSACADTADERLDEAAPLGEDGALVRGRVVSDEVFPVAGALVQVVGGSLVAADEEGYFEMAVAAGPITLNVTAEGYQPLEQDLDLSPGETADVMLRLQGIPGATPYVESLIFGGFIGCGWAIVYGAGWYAFTPCPSGPNKDSFAVEVAADWAAGVHEMTWETNDEMLLASSLVGTCAGGAEPDPCPGLTTGKDPLRLVARPQDPEYAKQYAVDGKAMWPEGNHTSYLLTAYNGMFRTEINETAYPACAAVNGAIGSPPEWGCPFGVGVTLGIRYDLYHTTFYRDEPFDLAAFTAIPDT